MPPERGTVALVALVALAATWLAACDEKGDTFGTRERKGKPLDTLYINNSTEPEYIDPGKSSDTGSAALCAQLFEGLTSYHPKDQHPVQGVATSWDKSPDNRLYRFHLRPEARWSDGKPVTAHDFEYGWKRVLRPATASQASSNLYAVMNAELFNLGKLLVAKKDVALTQGPRGGAEVAKLAKGAAVVVLGQSPRKVTTKVAPLAAVRDEAKNASLADGEITFDDGKPKAIARGDGWKGAEVDVLAAGPEVTCNGQGDRWFQVRRGSETGFLPGCALGASDDKHPMALVRAHSMLPTFVEGAERAQAGATGFVAKEDLEEDDRVVGVRAVDDLTLEVELGEPAPYFLDLTSLPTLAPARRDVIEAFAKQGKEDLWTRPENIVTNGPYTLEAWRFRYEIVLQVNPAYWNRDKIKARRVVFLEIEEAHATMNLFKVGDLDFIGDNASLPPEYMGLLQTKKEFVRTNFLGTYWYELNTKVAPTNDVRVRRALNLAVDKQQITEKIVRGGQTPATHYVPDFTGLGYGEQAAEDRAAGKDPFSGPDATFNPELARKLLAEAGYTVVKDGDGFRAEKFPPLEILYNTSEGHRMIAVAVQDMWKKNLGVTASLHNEEWKVMLKNIRDGNFQVARFGWNADYNHANTWLETFLSTSHFNTPRWSSAEYDAALRKASATSDPKESIKLYRAAEKIAVDGMSRIPIYFYTRSILVKPWLKGFWPIVRGAHLAQYLWIDPSFAGAGGSEAPNEPAYAALEAPPPGSYTR